MLMSLGYTWVSTRYPAHPLTKPGEAPTEATYEGIVEAQKRAQPFVYSSGLIEVPASPVTDVVAFRSCRWNLEQYQRAIRESLDWAIAHRAVFDFTAHPSVLGVVDPEFRTLDLILEAVRNAGPRAVITDLGTIAQRAKTTP